MSTFSTGGPSGSRTREGVSRGIAGIREVIDELRNPSGPRSTPQQGRASAREEVLAALADGPADGYRIVRLLEERGHGERTPGAGAVYPTLQLLADEGLVTAEETDGRKVWTLTAAGHAAAEHALERPAVAAAAAAPGRSHRIAVVRSGAQLAQVVAVAAQSVTPEQVGEVVTLLDETRRRILTVLARS